MQFGKTYMQDTYMYTLYNHMLYKISLKFLHLPRNGACGPHHLESVLQIIYIAARPVSEPAPNRGLH